MLLHQHVDNGQFSEARLRCLATLLLLLSHAHKWDKWPFGGGGGDSLKAIACFKCCVIDATLGSVFLLLVLVSFVSKCVFGSSEQCSLFLFLLLFLSFDSVFCYNNSQWMLCLQNEWSHNVSVCLWQGRTSKVKSTHECSGTIRRPAGRQRFQLPVCWCNSHTVKAAASSFQPTFFVVNVQSINGLPIINSNHRHWFTAVHWINCVTVCALLECSSIQHRVGRLRRWIESEQPDRQWMTDWMNEWNNSSEQKQQQQHSFSFKSLTANLRVFAHCVLLLYFSYF